MVCSTTTVRRTLNKAGLYGRVARKKPLLDWTMTEWNKVVWSDESKFNLFGSDGRVYIRGKSFYHNVFTKLSNLGVGP